MKCVEEVNLRRAWNYCYRVYILSGHPGFCDACMSREAHLERCPKTVFSRTGDHFKSRTCKRTQNNSGRPRMRLARSTQNALRYFLPETR